MAASDKSRKYHDTRTRIELYRPGAEKHKAGLQWNLSGVSLFGRAGRAVTWTPGLNIERSARATWPCQCRCRRHLLATRLREPYKRNGAILRCYDIRSRYIHVLLQPFVHVERWDRPQQQLLSSLTFCRYPKWNINRDIYKYEYFRNSLIRSWLS